MSNGIGAPLPGFDTQVIPGRCKLYFMLAIACFGLLFGEAYVIGQPIDDFDVKGEMAKIRGGKYTKMPSPDKKSIDDHQTVTYEVKNDTKRELLFLFKGPNEGALVVKPGSSESTDVLPGVYEIAVREREEEGSILKPQYERLEFVRGTEYIFTYSSVTIDPCSIKAGRARIVQGQAVTFEGIVAPRAFSEKELEQAEYRFYFDDGTEREWSKERRARHIYSRHGFYEAILEVRSGGKKYTSHGVEIIVDRKPLAVSLGAEPVNPVTGQVVDFTAIPNVDTEGVEYKFDFGDGKVREWSGKTTAKHAYSSPGRYTPYVIARIGEEESQSGEIISVRRRPPIEVYLTVKPVRAKTGENVHFSADQKVRIEGTEFRFDFGDGEVSGWSTATTAKHAYAREKEYIASVKARLGDMAADSNPVIIQVMADDKQVVADYEVVIYAKVQRTRGGH